MVAGVNLEQIWRGGLRKRIEYMRRQVSEGRAREDSWRGGGGEVPRRIIVYRKQ